MQINACILHIKKLAYNLGTFGDLKYFRYQVGTKYYSIWWFWFVKLVTIQDLSSICKLICCPIKMVI